MARDNHPKARQSHRQSNQAQRAPYDRLLIVTEGSKTEPLYLKEIRTTYRLHSANIAVHFSQLGTCPLKVVEYARQLFENGDPHKGIRPKSFDKVYAVFDRDDHQHYFDALKLAESLDGKLKNDEKKLVSFQAIASVPNFELWLLLHYQDIQAPIHRNEVIKRLKQHILGYQKGAGKMFATTSNKLQIATERAQDLAAKFTAYTDPEPYTAIHKLVTLLTTLRK